jgi:hypothetical protein
VEDPKARRVFEIATMKMEYLDELSAVRERRKQSQELWMARTENRIRDAIAIGQVNAAVDPYAVALGLWAILDGLIRAWLLDPQSFDLMKLGAQIVDLRRLVANSFQCRRVIGFGTFQASFGRVVNLLGDHTFGDQCFGALETRFRIG